MVEKVQRQATIDSLRSLNGSTKIRKKSRGKVEKLALLKKKMANMKRHTASHKQAGFTGQASIWAPCLEDLTGPKTPSLTNKNNAYRKRFKKRVMLKKPLVQEIGIGLDKGVIGVALPLNRKSVRKGTYVRFSEPLESAVMPSFDPMNLHPYGILKRSFLEGLSPFRLSKELARLTCYSQEDALTGCSEKQALSQPHSEWLRIHYRGDSEMTQVKLFPVFMHRG